MPPGDFGASDALSLAGATALATGLGAARKMHRGALGGWALSLGLVFAAPARCVQEHKILEAFEQHPTALIEIRLDD